jgi:predicted acylesterase/phospholipase RssA
MSWHQLGRFLRICFFLRVPLVVLAFLGGFGVVALRGAEELLGNLLDMGQSYWYFFSVAFCSFLLAFAAVACINLVLMYGSDRFNDANLELKQTRPLLTFLLGSVPAACLLGCVAIRSVEITAPVKLALSFGGCVAAIALVVLAKLTQLALTDPSSTPYPPPYLIFPVYFLPLVERIFDAVYCWSSPSAIKVKGTWNRLAQWPLQIFGGAGQGYLINLDPPSGQALKLRSGHVFALCLATIAFGFYVGIGYRKAFISAASPRVPGLAYLLLFAIVACWALSALAFFFDRYRFPLLLVIGLLSMWTSFTPVSDHFFRVVRVSIPDDQLLTPANFLRHKLVDQGQNRLVFVATAGGGIQAAAWTVQVLTGLEDACQHRVPACDFRNSVAVISSVSGGSLGSMIYAGSYSKEAIAMSPKELVRNSEASALDEVAWGWMNPDVARTLTPWLWNRDIDRGWALEQKWARVNGLKDSTAGTGDTLLTAWAEEAHRKMPALIFNAMVVESGRPVVLSTTNFARKGNGRGLLNFYDLEPDKPGSWDVRVNTAVRLSASFPYVAPASRPNAKSPMASDYHFVDGGYYDNYGINSLIEWIEDGLRDPELRKRFPDILILEIRPFGTSATPAPTRRGWGFQIVAPIIGLTKMRDTAQDARDLTELDLFGKYYGSQQVNVWVAPVRFPGEKPCDRAPLSWKLSTAQADCVHKGWGEFQQSSQGIIDCVTSFVSGGSPTSCPKASNATAGTAP